MRLIKSFWKRLCALFSTRQARKDARSNSDQNIDRIAPSDSYEEISYQNTSDDGDRISESTPTPLSELQWEQLSTSSVVISQVGPADDHPSSQSSEVCFDLDSFESIWHPEDNTLPEVTISATIETGQAELNIKVPKQRNYTGQMPAIPSSVADIPCATLGVQGVLDRLKITLGTSCTLDTPSVFSILEDCVVNNYDFGTAYGRLRGVRFINNKCAIEDELRRREEGDKEQRRRALVWDDIWIPAPRRVWDLYSNRVVPWWIAEEWPDPISHAWVDEKDRVDVWTPINGNEWPVPIPKDTSLDLIRIEMLNMGVEYTWLDVLCLRQKGGPREDLRAEEWKLDVPTIGCVYRWTRRVVIYLGGLGRPLRLEEGDLESDRCWFRRAWTLQEVGNERIIAGDTPDGPIHAKPDDNGKYKTEILTRFHKRLKHMEETTRHYYLFETLADMRNRVSTNPVDRVAGLAYCLQANTAYHEKETVEEAWTALVNTMDSHMRMCILLLYPRPGLGGKKWRPTWEQVMNEPLPVDEYCKGYVYRDNETDEDCHYGHRIEQGFVRGLDAESAEGVDRGGELVVKDPDGMQHTFKILATHHFLIPDGPYTLLEGSYSGVPEMTKDFWVVGRSLPDQRFEKLSVIRIPDEGERERLDQCGFVQSKVKTYLL